MSAALNREIARINKMHLPAGERSDRVRRAKAIDACMSKPPTGDSVWCSRCGFLIDDHRRLLSRLASEARGKKGSGR